jgi:hypothetical protein
VEVEVEVEVEELVLVDVEVEEVVIVFPSCSYPFIFWIPPILSNWTFTAISTWFWACMNLVVFL